MCLATECLLLLIVYLQRNSWTSAFRSVSPSKLHEECNLNLELDMDRHFTTCVRWNLAHAFTVTFV
jgi:hypothetical protein